MRALAAIAGICLLAAMPDAVNAAMTPLQTQRMAKVEAAASRPMPAGAADMQARLSPRLTPAGRAWIAQKAEAYRKGEIDEAQVRAEAAAHADVYWPVVGATADGDIDALCFLVLMQASKSAQDDLKSIMAGVKSINNAKALQRQNLAAAQTASSSSSSSSAVSARNNMGGFQGNPSAYKPADDKKASLDAVADNMKNDLDSMSEMGETESLRLQMAMDRLSKMMSTLSNILKKTSDTSQSITQNLK
ncbi:MAG: hypothetical protein ACXU8O_00595 [Asticcacaulis sp.]